MKTALLTCCVLFWAGTGFTQTYLDSSATVEERIQDLRPRMTLDEKVGQMVLIEREGITDEDI